MTATFYKGVGFQGVYARLGPGLYSGRDLVGCPNLSLNCESLDDAINSLRVDPDALVVIADGHALSAGGGARVLLGPAEVPDLSALGMGGRISSVRIAPYRPGDPLRPGQAGSAAIYEGYSLSGRRATLHRGDYTPARLSSEEVRLPGPRVTSLAVTPGVAVVLYSGASFEPDADAMAVVGPARVDDLEQLGMAGRVNSIRVLYSAPSELPGPARARGAPAPGPAPAPGLAPLEASPALAEGALGARAPKARPAWLPFALIALFVCVIAAAAFLAVRAAKSRAERLAAEAGLVAQAAVPLALAAAALA